MGIQEKLSNAIRGIREKIGKAISETRRILRLTRKPKKEEFNETMKITGLGMIGIGLLGFVILLVSELVRGV